MRNILLTSGICFILTLAVNAQIALDTRPLAKMTPSATPQSVSTPSTQAENVSTESKNVTTPLPSASPSPETPQFSENDQTPVKKVVYHKPRTIDEIKAMVKSLKLGDDLPVVGWDKFKDESILMTKPENLVGSWEGAMAIVGSSPMYGHGSGTPRLLMVHVESVFAGKTLTDTPLKFALVFVGMSPDWQFLKTGGTLYVVYDGDKRMALEPVAAAHDVVKWNRVDESYAYVISRDELAALTAANKIEIRIGDGKPRTIRKALKHWRALLDVTKLEAEK